MLSGGRFYSDLRVYVARINRLGETGMARPCPECVTKLKKSNVTEMIYTLEGGGWKAERI